MAREDIAIDGTKLHDATKFNKIHLGVSKAGNCFGLREVQLAVEAPLLIPAGC